MSVAEKDLVLEVNELTDLLRSEPSLEDLRHEIIDKGLRLEEILMAGFQEDEHHHQFGLVVTTSGDMFEFERTTRGPSKGFQLWKRRTDADALLKSYQAVKVALKMAVKQQRSKPPSRTPYRD